MRFWMMRNVSSVHEPVTVRVAVKGYFADPRMRHVPVIVLQVAASTSAESFAPRGKVGHDVHFTFTRVPFPVPRTLPVTAGHPLWMPTRVVENETESVPAGAPPGTRDGPCTTNCPPGHTGQLAAAGPANDPTDSKSAKKPRLARMRPP